MNAFGAWSTFVMNNVMVTLKDFVMVIFLNNFDMVILRVSDKVIFLDKGKYRVLRLQGFTGQLRLWGPMKVVAQESE